MLATVPDAAVIIKAAYGRNILFYGLTGGKTMKFLGLEKSRSREESFYHRLKAIYGWYTRALGGFQHRRASLRVIPIFES